MYATHTTPRFHAPSFVVGHGSDLWIHAMTGAAVLAFLALWSPVFAVSLALTVATGWLWTSAVQEAGRGLPGLPLRALWAFGAICHGLAAAFGAWLRLQAGGVESLTRTGLQMFDPVTASESLAFLAASTAGFFMPILASLLLVMAALARRRRRARFSVVAF